MLAKPLRLSVELCDKVLLAFEGNEYPGDDDLVRSGYSPWSKCETFCLLKGKSWQEFPATQFFSGDTPLADLTDRSLKYYMPSLLFFSFEQPEITGSLLFYLSPESTQSLADYVRKISIFTRIQKEAICSVFREYILKGWEIEADVQRVVTNLLTVHDSSTSPTENH